MRGAGGALRIGRLSRQSGSRCRLGVEVRPQPRGWVYADRRKRPSPEGSPRRGACGANSVEIKRRRRRRLECHGRHLTSRTSSITASASHHPSRQKDRRSRTPNAGSVGCHADASSPGRRCSVLAASGQSRARCPVLRTGRCCPSGCKSGISSTSVSAHACPLTAARLSARLWTDLLEGLLIDGDPASDRWTSRPTGRRVDRTSRKVTSRGEESPRPRARK